MLGLKLIHVSKRGAWKQFRFKKTCNSAWTDHTRFRTEKVYQGVGSHAQFHKGLTDKDELNKPNIYDFW